MTKGQKCHFQGFLPLHSKLDIIIADYERTAAQQIAPPCVQKANRCLIRLSRFVTKNRDSVRYAIVSETSAADSRGILHPLDQGLYRSLITQFFVALNDNIFRWLIIPIGKCAVGWSDKTDMIRTIGSLAFLIPFLLLATAGYVCDRFNRRNVLIWTRSPSSSS